MESDSLLSSFKRVIKYDGLSKNFDHPCLTEGPIAPKHYRCGVLH